MVQSDRILYGGFEGTDEQIAEGARSLGELLIRKFESDPSAVLLVDGITGKQLTANDLKEKSIRVAECLKHCFDIKAGDVVGICSENRLEFAITLYATIFLGAAVAPFNVTYTERELHHGLNLSKPSIVFVSQNNLDKIVNVSQQNKFIKQIITYDALDDASKYKAINLIDFEKFVNNENVPSRKRFVCRPENMRENILVILCSSGTTGLPKGVQLTQFNLLVANVQHYNRPRKMEDDAIDNKPIYLAILPWFHAFGMTFGLILTIRLTKIIFLPKFDELNFLKCIEAYKANSTFLVPPIIVWLTKTPLIAKYNLSSLKVIWYGAAPLSKDVQIAAQNRLNNPVIRQGYGMTEGTLAYIGQTDGHHKIGSVGILRCGVWGRVVDIETGKVLGPNQRGELHFKGSSIMKGYIGDKQATNATIDANGWLQTGDIGYYDEDGEWFIVERIKELIKYKAFQVPPAEIEAILLTHDQIKDAGVIGVEDESAGELALAFVVKQPNATITEKDVIDFVAGCVSTPKRLHGGVKFVTEIPKNPSGKILRRILREMVKKQKSKL